MGHRNIATTQRHTHLRPVHEIAAHERLADAGDLILANDTWGGGGVPFGKHCATSQD